MIAGKDLPQHGSPFPSRSKLADPELQVIGKLYNNVAVTFTARTVNVRLIAALEKVGLNERGVAGSAKEEATKEEATKTVNTRCYPACHDAEIMAPLRHDCLFPLTTPTCQWAGHGAPETARLPASTCASVCSTTMDVYVPWYGTRSGIPRTRSYATTSIRRRSKTRRPTGYHHCSKHRNVDSTGQYPSCTVTSVEKRNRTG